jgi:glycosyltransferase involved in cell wall biosynthesis
MPLVSVIVTAYNSAPFIADTVHSVLAQTMGDWELIAFDDGSTDATLSLLREFAAADSRIKVVTQANSGRPSIARNRALQHATGDWVCFLDGDDLYHPTRLERVVAFARAEPSVDAVFHDYIRFRDRIDEPAVRPYLKSLSFRATAEDYLVRLTETCFQCTDDVYAHFTLGFIPIHTSTITLRRSFLSTQAGPFREDLVIAEDTDLWFRLARAARLGFIDEPLSYYRMHGGGITRNKLRLAQDGLAVHLENRRHAVTVLDDDQLRRYDKHIAEWYFGLAWASYCAGDAAAARRAYVNALRLHPRLATIGALIKTFIPRTRSPHGAKA